jgi:kinesin family protein 1
MKKQLEEEMAAEIAANKAMLEEQAKSWEDRYKESMAQYEEKDKAKEAEDQKRSSVPHIVNVNEDPALSHMVYYFFDTPSVTIGRKDAVPTPGIVLGGLSILKKHAVVAVAGGKITLAPEPDAKVMLNGANLPSKKAAELSHGDRVMLGASHLYIFVDPTSDEAKEDPGTNGGVLFFCFCCFLLLFLFLFIQNCPLL